MKIHTPQDELIDRKNGKIHLELFKKGFEGSPNSQVIAEYRNQDVHILQVNKAFTEYYGYSQEEAIGKNPRVLNSGKMSLDFFVKMWEEILDPKIGFWRGEIINKRKDGNLINVILTINTIFEEKKTPKYFTAYHIDITDRKIAEEKLKESEDKYRSFIEQSLDGVVLTDENGVIIEWNKGQEEISGIKKSETKGKPLWQIQYDSIPKEKRDPKRLEVIEKMIMQMIKEKESRWLNKLTDTIIETPENQIKVVRQLPFKIKTRSGVMLGSITRDITKLKEVENQLKESEEKYRIAYERAHLYGDLVAHDINNILHVISSSLELSSLYFNSPEKLNRIKELYEISKEQITRGAKLISNVHKLSKIDDSEINLKKTNINNILKEAIKYIKQSFQNKHIQIDTELGDVDLYINANDLLLDVFENLLINSIRHNSNPNVEICVKTSKISENKKKLIKFEFKDNGLGISDERKETIFTRRKGFNMKADGMGLGLSLVKKIIGSYNGNIFIEDKVKGDYKKGSNFIFLIPEAQ